MKHSASFPPVSCRYGAPMGRRDTLPSGPVKLRLTAARWTDYAYDQGGAYWGYTPCTRIYCGHNLAGVRIYVRASNPTEAAGLILEKCPDGSTCGGRTMVNGFPALVAVRQSQHAACVAMHASLSR